MAAARARVRAKNFARGADARVGREKRFSAHDGRIHRCKSRHNFGGDFAIGSRQEKTPRKKANDETPEEAGSAKA
jgi:hypothetical protein